MLAGMFARRAGGGGGGSTAYQDAVLALSPRGFWMLDETTGDFNSLVNTYPLAPDSNATRGQSSIIPSTASASAGAAGTGAIGTRADSNVILQGAEQGFAMVTAVLVNSMPADVAGFVHQGNFSVNPAGVAVLVQANGAIRFQTQVSSTFYLPASSAGFATTGTAFFLGVDHDPVADVIRFYKNGTLVSTVSHTVGIGSSTSAFAIGRGTATTVPNAYVLDGRMQGVATFSSALGEAALLSLAQAAGFA